MLHDHLIDYPNQLTYKSEKGALLQRDPRTSGTVGHCPEQLGRVATLERTWALEGTLLLTFQGLQSSHLLLEPTFHDYVVHSS